MPNEIISQIREELLRQVDEKTRESTRRFFKEEVKFHGVKTAVVEKMAARYFVDVKPLGKKAVFELCEDLLKSDYGEEAFIAFEWAYRLREDYRPEDFKTIESWLSNYVNNWAKCDTLCNHAIGSFIEKYPKFIADLKRWTQSPDRWLRRAAAVTLIIPARRGKFLADIFDIADKLLLDKDDLVQKGYGWMLKEASKAYQKEVFDYIMKHKQEMPRTALRYAIEKIPEDLRHQAMRRD